MKKFNNGYALRHVYWGVIWVVFLFSACVNAGNSRSLPEETSVESVYTDLNHEICTRLIDRDDPNSTPYHSCAGIGEYSLEIRHVSSGRKSIDVVTPSKDIFHLDYHDYITQHMLHLGNKAHWRIIEKSGKKIPIALIVGVHAHGDLDEPETVTASYHAIAKITPEEVCVTDKVLFGSLSPEDLLKLADSAKEKICMAFITK